MVEDEGAALGGALQAAWALAVRENRKVRITIHDGIVALDEATRCQPNGRTSALPRAAGVAGPAQSRVARGVPEAAQTGGFVGRALRGPSARHPRNACRDDPELPSGRATILAETAKPECYVLRIIPSENRSVCEVERLDPKTLSALGQRSNRRLTHLFPFRPAQMSPPTNAETTTNHSLTLAATGHRMDASRYSA